MIYTQEAVYLQLFFCITVYILQSALSDIAALPAPLNHNSSCISDSFICCTIFASGRMHSLPVWEVWAFYALILFPPLYCPDLELLGIAVDFVVYQSLLETLAFKRLAASLGDDIPKGRKSCRDTLSSRAQSSLPVNSFPSVLRCK